MGVGKHLTRGTTKDTGMGRGRGRGRWRSRGARIESSSRQTAMEMGTTMASPPPPPTRAAPELRKQFVVDRLKGIALCGVCR